VWATIALAAALTAAATPDEERERPPAQPCPAPHGEVAPPGCPGADPSQPGSRAPEPQLDVGTDDAAPWIDRPHDTAEAGLTALVYRLDRFFGDPTHSQFDPPRSWVRLRGGGRFGQADPPGAPRRLGEVELEATVLAHLRLPSLDRLLSRASLFISGGDDDDHVQRGTEQDLVPRRFDPSLRSGRGAAELRFDLFRSRRAVVDVGGGVRFRLPPPPYARVRFGYAADLGLGLVGHLNQTGFWERNAGFGEASRVDVERAFGRRTVGRVWGIATLHERSRGVEWSAETGLARGLGRRTGVYVAGSVDGATRSVAAADRWRAFTRLRRDVHEGWLFLELEPEVAWPAGGDGAHRRVLAATLRMEVQLSSRRRP
jgi:hypothetical protein